jgi:hypothetical protein
MLVHKQRDLQLSPEQTDQLAQTVSAHRETMRGLHAEIRPRIEDEMEALRADVEAVLTPEQAAQWNARFEDARETWMPRHAGWRGGGGGRGFGAGGGFGRIDANGDGALSREEAQAAQEMPDDVFDGMDTDGNGLVSFEEWHSQRPMSGPGRRGGGGAMGGGRGARAGGAADLPVVPDETTPVP